MYTYIVFVSTFNALHNLQSYEGGHSISLPKKKQVLPYAQGLLVFLIILFFAGQFPPHPNTHTHTTNNKKQLQFSSATKEMMVQLQPEWGWGGWRYGEEKASGKKEEKLEQRLKE